MRGFTELLSLFITSHPRGNRYVQCRTQSTNARKSNAISIQLVCIRAYRWENLTLIPIALGRDYSRQVERELDEPTSESSCANSDTIHVCNAIGRLNQRWGDDSHTSVVPSATPSRLQCARNPENQQTDILSR
jgi:hypothetical protein